MTVISLCCLCNVTECMNTDGMYDSIWSTASLSCIIQSTHKGSVMIVKAPGQGYHLRGVNLTDDFLHVLHVNIAAARCYSTALYPEVELKTVE